MERNNIFDFATSELSQDAFICWCLNWLNYEDSELRALAVDLLKEFGEEDVSDNQEIIIKRQFKKIDILVVLKGLNRVYIIEDKVHSSERKKQLEKYETKINELNENEKKDLGIDKNLEVEVKTVYFKTGFHFSPDKNVKANKIIAGKMFKEILEKYRNKNEILDSYYEYLVRKLNDYKNMENYLEYELIPNERWNICRFRIAQYCFLKEMFLEERVVSSSNSKNSSIYSEYNLLGKDKNIQIAGTNQEFCIFWRIEELRKGPCLRLIFYHEYDKKNEELKNIRKEKYETVYEKIYSVIEEYKNELPKIYKIKGKYKYTNDYKIMILRINLKEYIKAGKDEMDKLMNEVKKLHGYLQNVNFE
jgi:hypothetical protein